MTPRAPHETPIPGPAADFAATLAAQVPQIETARLRLRAPRLSDFDAWAEVLCGPATAWLGGPFSRDEAFTEFLASCGLWLLRGHGVWAVEPKAGGDVLGFVLLGFEPGDREVELGYLFRASGEGQGYASEAARALRDHAFTALAMDQLVSYVATENAPSSRLAARLGAMCEGVDDGTQVWVHRRTARGASHPVSRPKPHAFQTSKRGD